MVDIRVNADGLRGPDAVELVTKPLEAIVKGIDGVEHVYSQTEDDRVMVTARFLVGTKSEDAILRVHEKIRANLDRIPVGIPEPLIVGRGINDVAVIVLTLSPKPEAAERWTDKDLYELADKLRAELMKVDSIGLTYISGGSAQQIRVEPDPEKLSLFGVTLQQLVAKVKDANRSFLAGQVRDAGIVRSVAAGQTLAGIPDIGLLLISTRDGRPVYVKDVASVVIGPSPTEHRVWNDARDGKGNWERVPAVSLALAKRAGANAVVVSEDIAHRLEGLKSRLIPDDVEVTVTRDYGETANEKANELLFHLGLATISIVVLIAIAIGWREALVTLVVIPTTILLTMFAANLMGYTINRVSLFALIFSIGILVDDAIVVVENIARHWAMKDGRPRLQATIEAVAEVGNPTIVATLTVVAALLPMLFVSGLMGPYMAPIPANASAAMLFSFFVAMVVAPWLMLRLAPKEGAAGTAHAAHDEGVLGRLYRRFATPIVAQQAFGLDIPDRRRRRDAAVDDAVRDQIRHGQAAAVRQQVRNRRRGRSARGREPRGHRADAVRRCRHRARTAGDHARSSPMPARRRRSISTAWCVTIICANGPNWANCRSIWPRARDRKRASHDIALDLRQRLKAVGAARRHQHQGRRSAARSAGAGDAAGRDLRARRGNAPRGHRRTEEDLRLGAVHRRYRRFDRRAAAAAAAVDRPGPARVLRRRAARRLRHHPDAVRRRVGRLFASRRRPQSDRDRGPAAEARSRLDRGAGLDAGARQHAARQQDRGRTRRGRARRPWKRARRRSSAATAASPTW